MTDRTEKDKEEVGRDEVAEALADLFSNVSLMVKGELEGTNNQLLMLEKMNQRVTEEYNRFGDVASGLRVFVEQLSKKNRSFEDYVQQIDAIDQQVSEFEAVVSKLDEYVSMLEKKVVFVYRSTTS
ncbi:biogenesis of lysosome-related organelles complex 1 subunit 2-like protein [Carex littledalei]|uniref:Biogenesis of lysosome-related organelles complex 1 subunit 2-like protein n=1 Tax=Carex littledalei TaxID=544730 RepID=A0A833VNH0_9POAL|nr:biogenesis of lysosome-related organelles complex 1 subunit 2-like protein [Carex littledalei]